MSDTLWTSSDAGLATGGQSDQAWQASGVSIDTRTLKPGDLFVALKDVRDGHDFVAQAFANGAVAAIVSHHPEGVPKDAPLLIVKDVLHALEALGRFARNRMRGRVIGVTGSVGKTGAKEMLRTALASQGCVHASEKSYNNHWGVPLTLARMPADTDFAILEIGMNHPGEIGPLAQMADLDVAMITTVAAVHLAAFSGVEEIAEAKAEIFDGLKVGGTAVLNADLETLAILEKPAFARAADIIYFGVSEGAEFRLDVADIKDAQTFIKADYKNRVLEFTLNAPGAHLAMNALAVLAACKGVEADVVACATALSEWRAPDGRGVRETLTLSNGSDITLIDDSYNANPTSMAAALSVLANTTSTGRKIAILGDMLELGKTEKMLHADLSKLKAMDCVDVVHLAGPLMQALYDVLPSNKRGVWAEDADTLWNMIQDTFETGDTIMIKGSKGSQISKIVDALRKIGA